MKKLIISAFLLIAVSVYSQVKIPEKSLAGTIIAQNDTKIKYKNLKYENGKVIYVNSENGMQEFLYDSSIKSIEEDQNETSSEKPNLSTLNYQDPQKLTLIKDIKKYLKENNTQYKNGKGLNDLGTVFVVAGGAIFLIGGISNLSKANTYSPNGETKTGSSAPLIIGLAAAGAGVIMKITGHSQMKKAVKEYQNADGRKFNPTYYVLNNGNGIGLMMTF